MDPFIPLRKADAPQRLVYAEIDETPDKAGEVFDYASSKPYFAAWSADLAKASDGKNLGNVRSMHSKVAAGKVTDIRFDDKAKSIGFMIHIADDAEWDKVEKGIYTGISPGGKYQRRWRDGNNFRYTVKPHEISLVDSPCIPSAGFTLIKADGGEIEVPFRAEVEKVGARNSAADRERIQQMHDTAVALGACCASDADDGACGGHGADALSKMAGELDDTKGQLRKMAGALSRAEDELAKMAGENDRLAKEVARLEALPAPGGPVLRVVGKGEDVRDYGDDAPLEKIHSMPDGQEKSLALIKLSQRAPRRG
ncbi:MAG: hypothetical protein WCJ64_04850 [Rhodospirillaceae bacterium]